MRLRTEQGVWRIAEDFRRIERGNVVAVSVVGVLKCRPSGVHYERAEPQKNGCGRNPPGIASRRVAEPAAFPDDIGNAMSLSSAQGLNCSIAPNAWIAVYNKKIDACTPWTTREWR